MTDKELIKTIELFSHKLKNPLHAIGINLDVVRTKVRRQLPQDKDIAKHLSLIASETERLQEIVLKYLTYLKLSDKERQKLDLRKLFEGN